GATSFSVGSDGKPILRWPAGPSSELEPLRAALVVGQQAVGELRVGGVDPAGGQARLIADAALVARLAALEGELGEVTSELIESQDLVLALYGLVRATRASLDPEKTLAALLR